MKFLLSLLLAASPFFVFAQGDVQKIALNGATAFHLSANMSGVTIITGGQDEVSLRHVLTVDGKDRPDMRELDIQRSSGKLTVDEIKPNHDLLEKEHGHRGNLTVSHRPGQPDGDYRGTRVLAYLEITVPANVTLTVETLYGGIEATGVQDMPWAKSRYGGITVVFGKNAKINALDYESDYQSIDLTIPASLAANVDLDTQYGSLYTDFDISIKANGTDRRRNEDPFSDGQLTRTINGGGDKISLHAQYQNIYLRKGK